MIMRLNAVMRRRLEARERGSASLESIGMYVIAGVLVVAMTLAAVSSSPQLADMARQAVCKVVTLGQGPCEPSVTSEADHRPTEPCVLGADGYNKSAEGTVLVVNAGKSDQFLVEKLDNGTFRLTRGTGGKLGVADGEGASAHFTLNGKTWGAGRSVGAGAALTFANGEVYFADNEAKLKELVDAHARGRAFGDTGSPSRGAADWVSDRFGSHHPTLPEPDEQYFEAGASADAQVQIYNMNNNIKAGVGAQAVLGFRKGRDGSSTTYFKIAADGNMDASMWSGGQFGPKLLSAQAGADGKVEGLVEVERDTKGNITAVRYKSIVAGRAGASVDIGPKNIGKDLGHYEEMITNLPIRSVADQLVAQRYLNGLGLGLLGGFDGLPRGAPFQPITNPVEALSATKAFSKAADDRGTTRKQHFDDTSATALGAGADLEHEGVPFGLSGKVDIIKRKSTDSAFYNGRGGWTKEDGCAAQ